MSADAYLEAADILLAADSKEGHAAMPVRFLLFHAVELYLKSFIRVTGMKVADIEALGHSFDKLFDQAITLGFRPAAEDYLTVLSEQQNGQVIRSRYLFTGTQLQVPLCDLHHAVRGLRQDLRNNPVVIECLIFRPWDVADGNVGRKGLPRIEPIANEVVTRP